MESSPALRVISMGAGVQSTMLSILAAEGAFGPLPDCAIFADTQWEPLGIYSHLKWLESQLPFPIHTVTAGNLREHLLAGTNSTGQSYITIPAFTNNKGMGRRQCTKEYKIEPVRKELRRLLGVGYRQRVPKGTTVELWLGISTDEIIRMKESRFPFIKHRFPLIEAGISRTECLRLWKERFGDRPLEKSACIGCPYRPTRDWLTMRENDPESWEDAVKVDAAIRDLRPQSLYLHPSCKPLSDLAPIQEKEWGFLGECDGLCDT